MLKPFHWTSKSLLVFLGFVSCVSVDQPTDQVIQAWVADPHHRIYHGSFGRELQQREITVEAARNEWVILQLAVKSTEAMENLHLEVTDLVGSRGRIAREAVQVRYPEFLPVDENGQWTPDPLRFASAFDLESNKAQPIWVDVQVPEDSEAGSYHGSLSVTHSGRPLAEFDVALEVLDFTLSQVTEDHFYFNILMDLGSIARLHGVDRWSEKHWELIEKYVENWAQHSQDAITIFLIEDPWESLTGFPVAGNVIWRLPGSWEDLAVPKFELDYSHFDRFVRMCLAAGIDENIQCWSPLMMPHLDYSVITYEDTVADTVRKLRVEAGSSEYEQVWSQFAKSFQEHLKQKGWLELTTVGLDEISTENLDKVIPVFQKIAPDLRLMVSGGDEEGKYSDLSPEMAFYYGHIDSEIPFPDISKRRSEGKRTLLYTAVRPLRPNTFLFSEPLESRMLPWLVWKYDFDGYIRWAWNYWVEGFWEQPRHKWRSGDMYLIYPGEDGPLDSIRTEMFRKGAQDYECLWMIAQHLKGLREEDRLDEVNEIEQRIKEAMELATRQVDPIPPYDSNLSDLSRARKLLNQILCEMP